MNITLQQKHTQQSGAQALDNTFTPLICMKILQDDQTIEKLANEILSTVAKELKKMTPGYLNFSIFNFRFKYPESKTHAKYDDYKLNNIDEHIKEKLPKSYWKHFNALSMIRFDLNMIYADPNVRKAYIDAAAN